MKRIYIICILFFYSLSTISQEPEYDHIFFENSLMPNAWFYSHTSYKTPGYILNIKNKLPIENKTSFTPGNCLKLNYKSSKGGEWKVQLDHPDWRGKDFIKSCRYLSFFINIQDNTQESELPGIAIALKNGWVSGSVKTGVYIEKLIPNQWINIKIPLEDFMISGDLKYKKSSDIHAIIFQQDAEDGKEHRLLIDQLELIPGETIKVKPKTPVITGVKAFERHVDISWEHQDAQLVRYVKIYRSVDNKSYIPVGIQNPLFSDRYVDFTGIPGKTMYYRISFLDNEYHESVYSVAAKAKTYEMTDNQLLNMVQEACFRYYWDGAEKNSGMALENIPGRKNMIATGASGFGIMALIVGTERGFISKEQLTKRLEKIVTFIEKADRFHGVLSHFIDGPSGKVEPYFGKYDNGGDLVETSFLMQGLLAARQYLSDKNQAENKLKERISAIWKAVEWNWYKQNANSPFLFWHWSPDHGWHINHPLIGWNETMITYFLAISSPTYPISLEMYYSGWASRDSIAQKYRLWGQTTEGSMYINGKTYFGIPLAIGVSNGGPLFFIHYSYLGMNPNCINDRYTNYFNNNKNIALINYRYCCENQGNYIGYGPSCWGLTASDGPWGYKAREPIKTMDDGTIAPTGSLSSFPYLPEESMDALKFFYRECGSFLWGEYGFRDAFNLSNDWCANIYMGLNQAPIVVMIENYRTGLIWNLFMSCPEIQDAIIKLGFENPPIK